MIKDSGLRGAAKRQAFCPKMQWGLEKKTAKCALSPTSLSSYDKLAAIYLLILGNEAVRLSFYNEQYP